MELYREPTTPAPAPYGSSDPGPAPLKKPERTCKEEKQFNDESQQTIELQPQQHAQQSELSLVEIEIKGPIAHIVHDVDITYINQQETNTVTESKQAKKHRHVTPKYTLKKPCDPKNWSCNIRKLQHQKGEEYINRRGKLVPARKIKNLKDCRKSCYYKCSRYIDDTDRQHIFKAFYSLNSNEKKHFLLNTTERHETKTTKFHESESRRKYSYKYFFRLRNVRYSVCKEFYLGTLAISQKPVYNVHEGKSVANIPKPDGRGMNESSNHKLSSDLKEGVREHIRSFPVLDTGSHCRPTKKLYLDSSLTVKKMYEMYLTKCSQENRSSVKLSMYRYIFKNEFNFHIKSKKRQERCDICKKNLKNND